MKLYLTAIVSFLIFRIILFITESGRVNFSTELSDVLHAFVMGIRFDIVVSSYLLYFPAVILLILDIIGKRSRIGLQIIFLFVFALFALAFLVCAADIPYFNQFFSRFSVTAFEWMDTPSFVFKMIFQEPKYYIMLIPWGVIIFLFFRTTRRVIASTEVSAIRWFLKIPLYIIVLGCMLVLVRGRVEIKSPIRVGTAYFCHNPFLNQLGLNPVFTLMASYIRSVNPKNREIHLINVDTATLNVVNYLGIKTVAFNSPIARSVVPDTVAVDKPNVVLVIMESMSAARMGRHGNKKNLTPFLDSLSYQSIYFDNIYTAGKHTFNGIFGSLCSFPAIFRQHPLKTIRHYNGISGTLKKAGYQTVFFTNHDAQFDNVQGFMFVNDFDQVISQKNYPSHEVKTNLGVPDDFMFRYSIPLLNDLDEKGKPFLSVFMTSSNHHPYYIPKYFIPQAPTIDEGMVQYCDWSLNIFLHEASKQKWYNNTIFVFVADHGAPLTADYDISLDYHHSPFIIYRPNKTVTPKTISKIGGQIDVFPTIMGILRIPYLNNSLGIDLQKESRPYIIINNDNMLGVLDNEFLLIFKENEKSQLFRYTNHDKTDYAPQYPAKVDSMEKYSKSNLQVYQYMIKANKTYVE